METYLIAGLGNFGKKYENTRHNAGFLALDHIAENLRLNISENKFKALCGSTTRNGIKLFLMKPFTFMNLSGEAILPAALYFDIPFDHIIIIYDDVYLDMGRIRIRPRGSSGGHNGVENIIKNLKSQDFPRVRIGIGPKTNEKEDLKDFVLGRFDSDSKKIMEKVSDEVASAVLHLIDDGLPWTMDHFNGLKIV